MHTLRAPLAAFVLLAVVSLAPAQSLEQNSSLAIVPADASFYSAMLRNREQLDRLLNSNAFKRVWGMPAVQEAIGELQNEWDEGDLEDLRYFLEDPANAGLVRLAKDMFAHEVFVFGGERYGDWLGAIVQLGNRVNMAQLQAAQRGEDPEEATEQLVLDALQNNPELTRLPATVFGFKLTDTQVAKKELERLEQLLKEVIAQEAPELEGHLKRTTVADSEYLTLELDGSLIPWDEVMEDEDLDFETQTRVIKVFEKVTVNVYLGVRGEYLLAAIGPDSSVVEQLGEGPLLAGHEKFLPLKKYFPNPVNSLGYVSGEFIKAISNTNAQLDQFRVILQGLLPMAPISPEVQEEIKADLDKMAEQIKQLQPEIGALAAISFEIDGGYETVAYNWTEARGADDSEPLSILRHVGGNPIGFYASRAKAIPEEQEFVNYWSNRLWQYVEKVAVPMMGPEQRGLFEEVKEKLGPLGERFVTVTRDKVAPAFASGESALVFDGQTTSRRWIMQMPTADKALPMPEMAFVWEVSDAQKLREGLAAYFQIAQDAITAASEISSGQIPPFQIPGPAVRETEAGEIKLYMLPPVAGVDPKIAPNSGLSDDVYVLSFLPRATERLMKDAPLEIETGPLAQSKDKPLASAWMFQTHKLISVFRPWLDYGLKQAEAQGEDVDPEVISQVNTVLDVLECIRTASGIGYLEDGAFVSHSRTEFQDLE